MRVIKRVRLKERSMGRNRATKERERDREWKNDKLHT